MRNTLSLQSVFRMFSIVLMAFTASHPFSLTRRAQLSMIHVCAGLLFPYCIMIDSTCNDCKCTPSRNSSKNVNRYLFSSRVDISIPRQPSHRRYKPAQLYVDASPGKWGSKTKTQSNDLLKRGLLFVLISSCDFYLLNSFA